MLTRLLPTLIAFCLLIPGCAEISVPSCSGTSPRLASEGALTVAADYSYPPFAFRDEDGDLSGFEVELMQLVAHEMELEVRFVNRGAGSLVTGLLANRHDVAASGLHATSDLEAQTCVTAPYMAADLGVLVRAPDEGAYGMVRDLRSRTVAVLGGSEAERWALANLGRSTVASLPTTDDLLTALQQEQADAVVADLPFVRFTSARSNELALALRIETGFAFVIATAKDNGPLADRLNGALDEVKGSRAFRELERRWFGS